MTEEKSRSLTQRQKSWLAHIKKCGKNQTMKEYAAKHGLNLSAFYDQKAALKKKGFLLSEPHQEPLFQQVVVAPENHALPNCRIKTPDGFVIELAGEPEPRFLSSLLKSLGALS